MQVTGIKTEEVQAQSTALETDNNGVPVENNAKQDRPKEC